MTTAKISVWGTQKEGITKDMGQHNRRNSRQAMDIIKTRIKVAAEKMIGFKGTKKIK